MFAIRTYTFQNYHVYLSFLAIYEKRRAMSIIFSQQIVGDNNNLPLKICGESVVKILWTIFLLGKWITIYMCVKLPLIVYM